MQRYDGLLADGIRLVYGNEFYVAGPDLTSQIAVNWRRDTWSRRLYYISQVLRSGPEGQWQAGAEVVRGDPLDDTVEAISLMISCLESLGIGDFSIDVGDMSVIKEAVPESLWEQVRSAFLRRSPGVLRQVPLDDRSRAKLLEFLGSRGESMGIPSLEYIREKVGDSRLTFDMCTVNPEPYYSGIVFEVYSPRSGVLLGRGGRYSIGSFSGSGFALDMEAIASLYDNRRGVERRVITRSDIGRAMVEARRMVSMGIPVEVVP
ncbi:hypothetical protein GCM10007108_12230 [Thermogymnomonas acidicola]|uniref:Class II Histidinyl-tRNA synthetase (HisRS)-like catalytic core domain-containing protein n=1 Tax=Thermogymnomonas acidicola TaxID=399579 RepID=A0AA37BSM6_9ARCH|nr:hypothetical protein GCM10007108_12230 [Thermogymnomonas acidicola]